MENLTYKKSGAAPILQGTQAKILGEIWGFPEMGDPQ